jgi:hypothetical protein
VVGRRATTVAERGLAATEVLQRRLVEPGKHRYLCQELGLHCFPLVGLYASYPDRLSWV